jgi:hypothetical protein
MNKKQIRITESDLRNIVKESVNRVLNERTYQEAMEEEYNEYKNYVMNLYNHLLDAKKFLERYEHDGLWRFEAKWIYPAVVDAIYKIKEHIEDD